MIPKHCSTAEQRVQWVSELLAHPTQRGLLSHRSRSSQVSRQTLYRWEAKGAEALQAALSPSALARKSAPVIERAVLTLLVEGHASYRGIQACLKELLGVEVSLGSIVSIVHEAGSRAQACLEQQHPETACALALDEQYSSKRGEGYRSASRCSQFSGLGQHAAGHGGWRKLDYPAVVSARARHRVGEHRERWRASDSRGLDDVEGQRHPST